MLHVRGRVWLAVAAAAMSLGVLLPTVLGRNWIELLLGVGPDRGSGSLELLVLAVSAAGTLGFVLLAWVEWRRLRSAAVVLS
jgi:hypothetical protein